MHARVSHLIALTKRAGQLGANSHVPDKNESWRPERYLVAIYNYCGPRVAIRINIECLLQGELQIQDERYQFSDLSRFALHYCLLCCEKGQRCSLTGGGPMYKNDPFSWYRLSFNNLSKNHRVYSERVSVFVGGGGKNGCQDDSSQH